MSIFIHYALSRLLFKPGEKKLFEIAAPSQKDHRLYPAEATLLTDKHISFGSESPLLIKRSHSCCGIGISFAKKI
jgi:hypothetical protein